MDTPYDESFEEFERRTGLDSFWGEFSTEVRGKLLSKNLEKPSDIYDILYPKVRQNSLSKNVPISSNLDDIGVEIRNRIVQNHIDNQISLEDSGQNQREVYLAKNKIISPFRDVDSIGEEIRKSSIIKNESSNKTIDTYSDSARKDNIYKNVSNESNLLETTNPERERELNKNFVSDKDPFNKVQKLSDNDEVFRNNNLNKNESISNSLELDSESIRRNLESKNKSNNSDLLLDSESERRNLNSKNSITNSDIEEDSKEFRQNSIFKNEKTNLDLEKFSTITRNENLHKNLEKNNDLEVTSEIIRNNSITKNIDNKSDLDNSSSVYRENNINSNLEEKTDLQIDSESFLNNSLSKNITNNNELESLSNNLRKDNISKNKIVLNDLEKSSEGFRKDSVSQNNPINNNLESSSISYRNLGLQNNVPNTSDLESSSLNYRDGLTSNNISNNTNLELDSHQTMLDNVSSNNSNLTNLESDSVGFMQNNISNNQSINYDLENESINYRDNELSSNVPITHNLENESVSYRNNDLSFNVQINHDLENESTPFRTDNINGNVPINSNLEQDTIPFLNLNLSSNIPASNDLEVNSQIYRANELSNNISNGSDLGLDSTLFRNDNVNSNVHNTTDLFSLSQPERNQQISNNVDNIINFDNLNSNFRNENLAKNPTNSTLGTNVSMGGSSTFVGISNLEIQGAIFRTANKVLNKNNGLANVFDDEESIKFFDKISQEATIPGGRELLQFQNTPAAMKKVAGYTSETAFGTKIIDGVTDVDNGLNKSNSSSKSSGFVTNLISLYNVQQNAFQIRPGNSYSPGNSSAYNQLISVNDFDGFTQLKTINGFGLNKDKIQFFTNTTPQSIIAQNNGNYLSADADKILKPNQETDLGTGTSMAAQTDTTDTISQDFDKSGTRSRGVRFVIDQIKSSQDISFARNFNVQGTKDKESIFISGKNKDGTTYKKSYNRFSIKNPYAPTEAMDMQFSLTNYSMHESNKVMAFPAYIKSFQHGDAATWNSTTFLGRPEPIYTYSNSSRDGSISFVVLTDYATNVDIGYEFNPNNETVTKITEDFSGINFVNRNSVLSKRNNDIDAELNKINEKIKSNITELEKDELKSSYNDLETQKASVEKLDHRQYETYSDNSAGGVNLYKFIEGFQESEIDNGDIESKPENTVKKLSEMKSQLMFQPSYFSGSKADFVTRMEFISKMTRPARNNSATGFSFTKAPVCHVHLGDWFNHDIIVNSVSYDYADAPWTTDGGKVYPMWCVVTLNFNIIGSYGAYKNEDAPLSTDIGGFFGQKRFKS